MTSQHVSVGGYRTLKTQSGKVSKAKAKSIASPYITAVLRAEHV